MRSPPSRSSTRAPAAGAGSSCSPRRRDLGARVGVALAVGEEEVGGALQLLEGLEEGGELAEGEEAGDVGEGDGGFDDLLLDGLQIGVGEEDGGADEGVPS